MAVRNYSNITNVGTLSGAVGTGETTLPINGGWSNLPAFPFYIIVDRGSANEEDMLATGGNATALQVTRGFDGSPASSHGISATVEVGVLAEFFNKADQHVEASTNVHGLSGGAAVVGTTQTQTLTNKTINSSVVNVAHSTSPAASQAIQVSADSATARDGFVWNKSASATGAAFKAISSGTTRFTVDADGKVVLNSGTGTDKALAVQESATERFSVLNDGTADFGLQQVGASGDRVTIRNRPTQVALRIRDQAAASVFSVGSAGNVDASGYIASATTVSAATALSSGTTTAVGTNLTVGGTAAVTGTSTLTGDVTLPLPAAGTTQRLIINSRTGGTNIEGRNQSGTATFFLRETGQIGAAEKAFIHNSASPVVAGVANTGVVPSPTSGLFVFDDSDGFIKRYNGSSYVSTAYHSIKAPRGYISRLDPTTNRTLNNTEAMGDTITFAAVTGRIYKFTFSSRFSLDATGVLVLALRIASGGSVATTDTLIRDADPSGTTNNNDGGFTKCWTATGTGNFTVGVGANVGAGASSGTLYGGASGTGRMLLIEDIGS
jgi:hypothetical protein